MRIYIKYVTRHLPYPYFSRNFGCSLWRTSIFCGPYIPKILSNQPYGIIFDVLRTVWSGYFNVTDTLCQFCGISGVIYLESRLEVIWGRWFFAPIESAYMTSYWFSIVTLVLSCRVSQILELLYCESRFFDTPPLKFQGVSFGIDPWCWVCKQRTSHAN